MSVLSTMSEVNSSGFQASPPSNPLLNGRCWRLAPALSGSAIRSTTWISLAAGAPRSNCIRHAAWCTCIPASSPTGTDRRFWDVPATRDLTRRACFDCHSNETTWPWCAEVAPFSWLIQRDADGG